MSLSDMLTTATLIILVYAGAHWLNGSYIAPRRAARAALATQSVKKKPRKLAFKARSQGSNVQNAGSPRSTQQDAVPPPVNVPNVQTQIAPPAESAEAEVSSSDGFTLTPRELIQLADALNRRREGATVEEAVCGAFGVKKGAGAGYVRAKALYDAATVPPGAAPEGTYVVAAPLRRARRAHR